MTEDNLETTAYQAELLLTMFFLGRSRAELRRRLRMRRHYGVIGVLISGGWALDDHGLIFFFGHR